MKSCKKKKLPIGISDFKEIIENNYYYFDKTKFIANILEDGSKVKLFTRPRRFGKTLNISMLKYFFDIKNKDENRKLFENLEISKNEYFEKQGNFFVISISFKNYDAEKWESGFNTIKNEIKLLYNEFYLIRDNLNQSDLADFDDIWLKKDNADWINSLFNLTRYLYELSGKKVVVLIDEYDQPIIDSYIKRNYEKCIAFFKAFYGKVLKDNNYLEMGILTGILRVAKENIFSGLNNLEVHTILDDEFTEYFGIMENEVEKSLEDFDLKYELNDVQKWYNGYLFGEKKVYNSWSIINFLNRGNLKSYWVNTSGNGLIKLYIQKLKNDIFDDFSKLLNNEEIFLDITDALTTGKIGIAFLGKELRGKAMRKNIYFYETNTPIGKIGIATTENDSHITDLTWESDFENLKMENDFQVCETELIKRAKKQLFEYFEGKRKKFNLPLLKAGTPFQISVWNALEKIPYGETHSYKDIAIAIGNPKAVRAVGMANNRNKIAIFIPCHRVIGANGKLVGYGGGLHIKRFLLELEGIKIK